MAAKIKLQRVGTKNRPFYRVVVQDESATPSSRVIEILGQYQPLSEPTMFNVDKDKALAWIKKGAMPTDKVRILLGKAGILPPIDLTALPKRKKKGETPPVDNPAPAESAAKAPEAPAVPAS